jgi:DNA helicase-2/ATP-dependent DNA helicase PcrA
VENLESLLHGIARFEERNAGEGVAGYLARLSLDSRDEEPEDGEGDAVTLMTLHSAKGLEWPVVFLCGVEEDLLPHSGMQGEVANPDEERRLAYVGITRAREKLFLTRAASRFKNGQSRPRTPSRFLGDIPDAHLRSIGAGEVRKDAPQPLQRGRDFFARMKGLLSEEPP